MSKALRFLQIAAEHHNYPVFTLFLSIKNFIPKYLDISLTDFALVKLQEHRGAYRRRAQACYVCEGIKVNAFLQTIIFL